MWATATKEAGPTFRLYLDRVVVVLPFRLFQCQKTLEWCPQKAALNEIYTRQDTSKHNNHTKNTLSVAGRKRQAGKRNEGNGRRHERSDTQQEAYKQNKKVGEKTEWNYFKLFRRRNRSRSAETKTRRTFPCGECKTKMAPSMAVGSADCRPFCTGARISEKCERGRQNADRKDKTQTRQPPRLS